MNGDSNTRLINSNLSIPSLFTGSIQFGTMGISSMRNLQLNNGVENVIHDVNLQHILPLSNLNGLLPNFTQQYQSFSNTENMLENSITEELLNDYAAENVTSNYNARCQIYKNKDIFYNINDDDIDYENFILNDMEKYKSLNNSIIEGKNILLQTLNKHVDIIGKKNVFLNKNNSIDNLSIEINQKLNNINDCIAVNHDYNETEKIKENFDSIRKCLQSNINIIKTCNNKEIDKLQNDILQNKYILKLLSESFNIVKDCNLRNNCTICLQNEVDVFFTSCGHTCCKICVKNIGPFCHMCRKQISGIKSLFLNS